MRNLKKFLALVLAVMMTFSLMVTANAAIDTNAAVTDKDSITEEFKEAVAVLNGLKIITGYEDSTFRPDKNISRQEATALVYRLHSGDADNVKKDLYSTADNIAKFKDVNPNGAQQWSAGYIGYCANQEIIKGVGADRFNPTGNVTGYQMLAMVLRAIGYGQRGEYEGSGWQTRVATTATQLGMLKNIDDTNYAGTLSAPATRELVAEIVFQAALLDQVIWNDAFGYVSKNQITGLTLESLGVEKFDLKCSTYRVIDKWGRPGYYWFQGSTVKSDLSNVVATIKALPVKTYDTTVRECDVAHDLDIATNATYSLYVNRNTAITNSYRIEATDTVTKVGGQGRVTEFYGDLTNPHVAGDTWSKSVVMIDTYLAKVTNVTERVLDPAGHVIVPAYLYLDVYDGQAVGISDKNDAYEPANVPAGSFATDTVTRNTSEHRVSKTDGNWEYVQGDMVLLNGYTDYTQNDAAIYSADGEAPSAAELADASIDNGSGLNHTVNEAARNRAAFETNRLRDPGTDYANDAPTAAASVATKINIVQKSNPVLGKQTVTYWNQGKHTVDGKDYNDAMTLFLDVASTTTNTTFAWYFDTKGNLIGIDNVPNTVNYGVITSIWTSFNQGETNTDGTAKTYAKVLYADGTEATINIDKFLVGSSTAANGSDDITTAAAGKVMQKAANTLELTPVYDYGDTTKGDTMKASAVGAATNDAKASANLYVAPVASVNAGVEKWTAQGTNTGYFGIIKGNLFKFESSADGSMTAIEVGGVNTGTAATSNDGKYVGHYNYGANTNAAQATMTKLYKNFAYISVDGGTNRIAWMDSETKIMVNDGNADLSKQSIKTYTLGTLPGDVAIAANTEIDWADTDNDGRAEYVYVTGRIEGTTTYGLFYYNGGAAQWNGADEKGTMFGWLNGEPTTIEFDDEAEFNTVKNSQAYKGHLFALELTNGVVSTILGTASQEFGGAAQTVAWTSQLLNYVTTPNSDGLSVKDFGTNITGNTTPVFGLGSDNSKNGNPYTAKTEAIYYNDMATPATPSTTGESQLTYDASRRSISVDGIETYFLTPNSKVIGLGMGVNQESAILDYLNKSTHNDVTIVYEQNAVKSIVEIYVATDPNVTPGGDVTVTAGTPGAGVTTLTGTYTASNLDSIIKGIGKNSVVYYDGVAAQGAQTAAPGSQLLYFPFTTGGTAEDVVLTISKGGIPVFQESASRNVAMNTTTFFAINFAKGTSANTTINNVLQAGTYTYKVVGWTTGATLSSGTFVMY